MKICVQLIADSALAGINYFINQLILNYTPSIYYINSRKPKTSINQGLQLAACSLKPNFPGQDWLAAKITASHNHKYASP